MRILILSKEHCHEAITRSYDELFKCNENNSGIVTRSTTRGEPSTKFANSSAYHSSFLPKTVHELKSRVEYI